MAESNARAAEGDEANAKRAADKAIDRFDRVYFEMPGELAPKLAIAFAAEAADDASRAAGLYRLVAAVDPAYASACFGLSRCMTRHGDPVASADALDAVPPSHALHTESKIAIARVLITSDAKQLAFFERAGIALEKVGKGHVIGHQLAGQLLAEAAALVGIGTVPADGTKTLLGHAMVTRALKIGAEREYLEAARLSGSAHDRAIWLDRADAARPMTLF